MGWSEEQCWDQLRSDNPELLHLLAEAPSDNDATFFDLATPTPLANQKAVLKMVQMLCKARSSIVYVTWPCGTGKTSCIL